MENISDKVNVYQYEEILNKGLNSNYGDDMLQLGKFSLEYIGTRVNSVNLNFELILFDGREKVFIKNGIGECTFLATFNSKGEPKIRQCKGELKETPALQAYHEKTEKRVTGETWSKFIQDLSKHIKADDRFIRGRLVNHIGCFVEEFSEEDQQNVEIAWYDTTDKLYKMKCGDGEKKILATFDRKGNTQIIVLDGHKYTFSSSDVYQNKEKLNQGSNSDNGDESLQHEKLSWEYIEKWMSFIKLNSELILCDGSEKVFIKRGNSENTLLGTFNSKGEAKIRLFNGELNVTQVVQADHEKTEKRVTGETWFTFIQDLMKDIKADERFITGRLVNHIGCFVEELSEEDKQNVEIAWYDTTDKLYKMKCGDGGKKVLATFDGKGNTQIFVFDGQKYTFSSSDVCQYEENYDMLQLGKLSLEYVVKRLKFVKSNFELILCDGSEKIFIKTGKGECTFLATFNSNGEAKIRRCKGEFKVTPVVQADHEKTEKRVTGETWFKFFIDLLKHVKADERFITGRLVNHIGCFVEKLSEKDQQNVEIAWYDTTDKLYKMKCGDGEKKILATFDRKGNTKIIVLDGQKYTFSSSDETTLYTFVFNCKEISKLTVGTLISAVAGNEGSRDEDSTYVAEHLQAIITHLGDRSPLKDTEVKTYTKIFDKILMISGSHKKKLQAVRDGTGNIKLQ